MVDVQFNDGGQDYQNAFRSRAVFAESQTPGMARILMKIGLAKDEKTAGYILIAIVIIGVALTIFFSRSIFRGGGTPVDLAPLPNPQNQQY